MATVSEKTVKKRVRTRSNLSKRMLFYSLAIMSGVLTASFVVVDSYISSKILTDPHVFAEISWISGLLIIIGMMLFLALPLRKVHGTRICLGTYLDPNFKPFHLPPWIVMKYVLLGGVFMAFSVLVYFFMIDSFDPSSLVPLMSFVIIYLLIADFLMEKDNPTIIEVQAIMAIMVGILISTISSSNFDLKSIILTIVLMNGLAAGVTISHKKATQWVDPKTRKPLDSITIRFYSVLAATLISSIVFVIIMNDAQLELFKSEFVNSFPLVTLSMTLATLSYILFLRALRMGKMSIVNSLRSFSVIIAIPLTMIAHWVYPAEIPFDSGGSIGTILKSIGAILFLTGMISLALADVRVIAIAKVSGGGLKQIENIAAMKGVTRVSVLAGKYDLLITIRTRSIGKGYRQTIRKIKALQTVIEVNTITIVKEWSL